MTANYQHVEIDPNKRYFVFGDLHGKWQMLSDLLEKIDYDPVTDICISVGDMIDRGTHSYEVFNFFVNNPNNYAIVGNHEMMAIDETYDEVWELNGKNETMRSLYEHGFDLNWLQTKIKTLPLVIDFGDAETGFRIVHAEIPSHWDDETLFSQINQLTKLALSHLICWSRRTIDAYFAAGIQGATRSRLTYCGHTIVKSPITLGNQVYIDTGRYKLTCVNALTGEFTNVSVDR